MKNALITLFFALFAFGCGHVSQDEMRRELRASQDELRQEMADGDTASLDCSLNLGVYQQANALCRTMGAYCNVVSVYENHCLREGDGVELLPPIVGVGEAVRQAAEEFNAAMRQQQTQEQPAEQTE